MQSYKRRKLENELMMEALGKIEELAKEQKNIRINEVLTKFWRDFIKLNRENL